MRHLKSMVVSSLVAAALALINIVPAQAFILPPQFFKFAASKTLDNPGIVLIDPATDQTLFSVGADVGRAPASVLKLFSMSTVLTALNPDHTFKTSISATNTPGTFITTGDGDPWVTESPFEATKYHRAFFPTLINRVLALHPGLRNITLEYNNVYALDIHALQRYFSGRLIIHAVKVNTEATATSAVASIESPSLAKIIEFTLLYSDNVLADRLARTAARVLGFSTDSAGIQAAFDKTLADLGISSKGLKVQDGNGLSHKTRVTVRQIINLLLAIRSNPKFKVILAGLPTSGETGTLKNRFVNDAPTAVGLVHAKTGWINTTVSLAGFVTVGPNQYVFAVVANHIHNLESARQAARVTIDQMLGTIAKPLS